MAIELIAAEMSPIQRIVAEFGAKDAKTERKTYNQIQAIISEFANADNSYISATLRKKEIAEIAEATKVLLRYGTHDLRIMLDLMLGFGITEENKNFQLEWRSKNFVGYLSFLTFLDCVIEAIGDDLELVIPSPFAIGNKGKLSSTVWNPIFQLWEDGGKKLGFSEGGPVFRILTYIHQELRIDPPKAESVRQAIKLFKATKVRRQAARKRVDQRLAEIRARSSTSRP